MRARNADGDYENRGHKQIMQGVHFSYCSLLPPDRAQSKRSRGGQAGPWIAATLFILGQPSRQYEDQCGGGRCRQRAEEIHPPRPIAEGQQMAPPPAHQRVERVSGRVGDAKARQHELKFKRIVEQRNDGRRGGACVKQKKESPDKPRQEPLRLLLKRPKVLFYSCL